MAQPTRDEIEAAKTPAGAWTRETLAKWGIPWPPPKGWRRKLEAAADALVLENAPIENWSPEFRSGYLQALRDIRGWHQQTLMTDRVMSVPQIDAHAAAISEIDRRAAEFS
jgi:hypothetical protein